MAAAIGDMDQAAVGCGGTAWPQPTHGPPFCVSPTWMLIRWRGGLRCEIEWARHLCDYMVLALWPPTRCAIPKVHC